MITRKEIEAREIEFLAPYATLSSGSRGRKFKEPPCEFRTGFQRDHDRIVHSEAFRRLEYKTQVFVNHEGDYYRTRLTHTLEVAQMSRGIARTLRLNEDLAEAIALAHDLGHTPFGHSGEEALDRLMKDHGGFEHNRQSYRVVTLLERRYPDFAGLNLTHEVLDGILKHDGPSSLEAEIVNIADEIAYMNHDVDDGLESEMLSFEQMEDVTLWRELFSKVKRRHPKAGKKIWKYEMVRLLIHILMSDVKNETDRQLRTHKTSAPVVRFSKEMRPKAAELKKFLYTNLYKHYRVERMAVKAQKILEDLFTTYLNNPKILPTGLQSRLKGEKSKERTVCDYIAGMTDRFALDEHKKLFDPLKKV